MRVIIADDEKWVRATIVNTIPFEQLGMTLVCEASNGNEALELCRQHCPDILLTDIMMPGLSGLELISELKGLLPGIKIVIISGFRDFEYAKSAIKYGVSDYLLKPVNANEITRVLLAVKSSIIEEHKKSEEEMHLRYAYKRVTLPILYEGFLNQLFEQNSLTVDTIRTKLQSYGIDFKSAFFSVIVFSPDNPADIAESKNFSRFKAIIGRVMSRYLGGVSFVKTGSGMELITIVNHQDADLFRLLDNYSYMDGLCEKDRTVKAFSLCLRLYEKKFKGRLSIGTSSASQQITRFPFLYKEALDALSERFWEREKSIFFFLPTDKNQTISTSMYTDKLDEMVLGIKFSDCKPSYEYVDDIYKRLSSSKRVKHESVREFFWSFIQALISRLGLSLSFIEYETSVRNGAHPYETIRGINTLQGLIAYVKEIIGHISEYYKFENPSCNTDAITSAKRIIEENYYSDLSLELVAAYVHFNPAYFSEYFKKEAGMSFIDYKTHVRIEQAKKLLAETALNTMDISTKVGYNDPKYFSKLFKRVTGMTLYKYREEQGKNATSNNLQ